MVIRSSSLLSSPSSLQRSTDIFVNSCKTPSSQRWFQLSWLHSIFFVVFFIVYVFSITSSAAQISYSDHCSSVVPESSPTAHEFISLPFSHIPNGYCLGGDAIINQDPSHYSANFSKVIVFETRNTYRTEVESVFKVEGILNLLSRNMYYSGGDSGDAGSSNSRALPPSSWVGSVSFGLQGFWSKSSGRLCMVGSGSAYSREGKLLNLAVVLQLNNVKNSSTVTDLFSGTLESLDLASDSNYFDPISILVFPQMNYEYTLISEEESGVGCPVETNVPDGSSLSAGPIWSLSSILSRLSNWYELEYEHDCNSLQDCTPFGGAIGYLPRIIATKVIQFSGAKQQWQLLIKFQNVGKLEYYRPFNPSTTLVGEGWWDAKRNRLCVSACRILNTANSLANARVGNCSIRLSLRFPATWTMRNRSSMVGQIWSNRTVNDSEYFSRIMFQSPQNIVELPGLKYEYTEIDRAGKSCQEKKPVGNKKAAYPEPNSIDMQFDMLVKSSTEINAWGSSAPIFVGENLYDPLLSSMPENSAAESHSRQIDPVNISYKMSFRFEPGAESGGIFSPFSPASSDMNLQLEISAEGIYDPKTGVLCMVGCRKLSSKIQTSTKNDSMDCEILVSLHFSAVNSKNSSYTKGIIHSTRYESDPLHFPTLDLSSAAFTVEEARKSIWRMTMEATMVLISNTLAILFLSLQLIHVKKQPNLLPSNSLFMLGILSLGYLIPLVQDLNAILLGSHSHEGIVFVSVVTMVVFLLQCELFLLTLSSKLGHGEPNRLWAAERNTLYVSLPLYLAGFLITWLLNYQQHSLFWDLGSYAGLVVDIFLFPQILHNLFMDTREQVLSQSFYMGTTLIRLLPHAYDLYRAQNYAQSFDGSYIYANPGGNFYSTAWDVIIPCGVLLFSAIIFLQQRFGGCCILPKRFRKLETAYEMVPLGTDETAM